MEKLLIATTNRGKFEEIRVTLEDIVDCVFLKEVVFNIDFDEDGATYEENALKKAEHFAKITGLKTLADDSGIEVEALKGELGVKTRRFGAGEKVSDEQWVKHFLERMLEFPHESQRKAKFVCVMALVGFGDRKIFKGEATGVITNDLQAPIKPGIPLSSCFLPDGFDKVYAALTEKEKGEISHRGRALTGVKEFLNK